MDATSAILKIGQAGEIDLGVLGSRCVYDVSDLSDATMQVEPRRDETWSTGAVVTIMYSINGEDFYSIGTAETLSADGMTDVLNVKGVRFIAAVVTTAGAASQVADVSAWGGRFGRS